MESKLKNMLPLAGLLCSFFSTAVNADDHMQREHDMQRPAGHIREEQPDAHREITPSAGPRVTNGADVFITADFILWQPRIDNLEYAYTGLGDGTSNVAKGSTKEPSRRWEPGFKVGLGLQLDHDGWDTFLEYTWLRYSKENKQGFDKTLAPTWNINNAFSTVSSNQAAPADRASSINSAFARWDLNLNILDLELGRNFFVSQYLKLRPFAGLRGAWNDQKYTVIYTSPNASDSAEDKQTSHKMTNNQDYWAIGLRWGLNTAWHFTKEFSIYSDAALSSLWAKRSVTRRDQRRDNTVSNPQWTSNVYPTKNIYGVQPVVEMEAGLRYETWFSDDDYHFLVQTGWQFQSWTNFNQLLQSSGARGDLSLQGLVVKARFDF